MAFWWDNLKPDTDVQAELNKFASYSIDTSIIGHTPFVEVRCKQCLSVRGPAWMKLKDIRKLGVNGKCFSCA